MKKIKNYVQNQSLVQKYWKPAVVLSALLVSAYFWGHKKENIAVQDNSIHVKQTTIYNPAPCCSDTVYIREKSTPVNKSGSHKKTKHSSGNSSGTIDDTVDDSNNNSVTQTRVIHPNTPGATKRSHGSNNYHSGNNICNPGQYSADPFK